MNLGSSRNIFFMLVSGKVKNQNYTHMRFFAEIMRQYA